MVALLDVNSYVSAYLGYNLMTCPKGFVLVGYQARAYIGGINYFDVSSHAHLLHSANKAASAASPACKHPVDFSYMPSNMQLCALLLCTEYGILAWQLLCTQIATLLCLICQLALWQRWSSC